MVQDQPNGERYIDLVLVSKHIQRIQKRRFCRRIIRMLIRRNAGTLSKLPLFHKLAVEVPYR